MGIAIFPHPGQSFDIPAPAPRPLPSVAYPQPAQVPQPAWARTNPSPRERIATQHVPGRLMRRLSTLGVYLMGALISASVGPLIYAIGDRDSAVRWALDLFGNF
jgi:hypothetical protein